ncbi:MAG: hypothetical protein KatS3mg105_3818 [Gemmatales bacterium]|nr:MAG: hypothetical protein KatS3mg105_3818 [Gemmatales bacterium]
MSWYRKVAAVLLVISSGLVWADEQNLPLKIKKPQPTKFLRLKRDQQGKPVALETAIVRYVPAEGKSGISVDLISAVHLGDRSYYQNLNDRFRNYDAVLYELVAPEGIKLPRKNGDSPLAVIQDIAKMVLDLELQIEQIDYRRKNFVHADLTPQQMAEAIRKRGDNGLTLALSITADLLRQQNVMQQRANQNDDDDETPALDPLQLLVNPDGPRQLKLMLAKQFDQLNEGGLGKTLNTILIDDRNKAALKVMQKELVAGKKKLGIFYGAAHMPDFEKRLRDEYGLKRDKVEWITAWDLTRPRNIGNLLRQLLDP